MQYPFYGHVARLINNPRINYNKQLKNATGPALQRRIFMPVKGERKGKGRWNHERATRLAKQLNACHGPVHDNWLTVRPCCVYAMRHSARIKHAPRAPLTATCVVNVLGKFVMQIAY